MGGGVLTGWPLGSWEQRGISFPLVLFLGDVVFLWKLCAGRCWVIWSHRPGLDHTILLQYPSGKRLPITTTYTASHGALTGLMARPTVPSILSSGSTQVLCRNEKGHLPYELLLSQESHAIAL